jgi:phage-related protein
MKDVRFVGSSLDDLRHFPAGARREAGFELSNVQTGLQPSDWKPMSTVGAGAVEIRIKDAAGICRVIYVARFEEAIYVLHAFEKKTQKRARLILRWPERDTRPWQNRGNGNDDFKRLSQCI